MKKSLLSLLFIVSATAGVLAHGGGLLERCDQIPLPDCTHNWNAVTATDSALYLVGGNGYCFIYYYNGGVNMISTGTSDTLTGVQFLDNSVGYAWGKNGTLIKTINAGLNWSTIATSTGKDIYKVFFGDENNGFLMVNDTIKKTINGGASWNDITLPIGITFKDFHFFDALNGQICGQQTSPSITGFVYETSNGGSSWTQIYTDTCAFTKLFYTNDTTAYLYGTTTNQPLLLESLNTGASWAIKYTSTLWSICSDVVSFDGKPVFISSESSGQYTYNLPYFLDINYGLVYNPVNIYSHRGNGVEKLYMISAAGLYRYTTGRAVCMQINFGDPSITAGTANPYNIMAAGKKIRFKALLANTSLDTIDSVDGIIRCSSPYVTITDSIAVYKDVLSNGLLNVNRAWSSDWYEMELVSNIPNEYIIHLEFVYKNRIPNDDTLDRSIIDIPFLNSPFTITNVTVLDTSNNSYISGDSDGIFEVSETAALNISIKNTSVHYPYNIQGELRSLFPQAFIWDSIPYPYTGQGDVYAKYSIGSFNPNQIMIPVGDYVVTNNFTANYKIPFTLVLSGSLSTFTDNNGCYYGNYFNIYYKWGNDFYINNSFPTAPDSLLYLSSNYTDLEESKKNIFIYPNPNDGKFFIKTNGQKLYDKFEIFDLMGEPVNYLFSKTDETTCIDISNVSSGIYFLKIDTGEIVKIIKN